MVNPTTREIFQRLFLPLEIQSKTVHYEFLVKSKGIIYYIRFTKRNGIPMWRGDGRGWLVSKYKELDETHLRMTKDERQMVIDFCKKHLGVKGL